MKILYVRHGKSVANANLTIGKPDTPLAEEGLEQARVTGQDLRSHNVTAIVCSSFIRAQQTAEIIAAELGIPIHDITSIDELHERRMGSLEGESRESYGTSYFYDNDTDNNFESHDAVIARSQLALQKVIAVAEQTAGCTVVVGHAVSGFFLLQVAKGKSQYSDFEPFNQLNNAEIVEIKTK